MYNHIGTVFDTTSNTNLGLYLKIYESIDNEKKRTSIRAEFSEINISSESQKLNGTLSYSFKIGSYVEETYNKFINSTGKPGDSLIRILYTSLANIPFTDYNSNGSKSLLVEITASFVDSGDESNNFEQHSYGYIDLTPLINESDIIHTELSNEDKQALIDGTVAIKTKIIVQPESGKSNRLILTEEDSIKSWDLVDERYVPDNGFIGQFVARELTGELHNISDDFNIENRDIKLLIGIVRLGTRYQYLTTEDGNVIITDKGEKIYVKDLGDDITTWYSLGNFLITKPEDDAVSDNTKFEAFDYTVKLNKDFDANYTSVNFPVSFNTLVSTGSNFTASRLAKYTCEQVGLEFASSSFNNHNFIINTNQFTEGNSCRDVMKNIAQLAYGWCRIGWDNKVYIDEISTDYANIDSYHKLTNDNYYSLTTQRELYGPVNKVVVGMSAIEGESFSVEDTESIVNNGLTEIDIMDNPILYTEELRNLAMNGADNLLGLLYTPFESETPGHIWFNGNIPIVITDMENIKHITYPFNKSIHYTGHIKTDISGPSNTKQELAVAYARSLYKTIKNVGIKVDKYEGIINIVNSNIQAAIDGLSSLENRFDMEITETYSKQQIQEIISGVAEDGTVVSSVKSTAGTFDMNGLTIEQSTADTATNINANGMIIYNKTSSVDDPLLTVNSNGVVAKNVKVSTYLNIGSHSRIEDYTHTDGSVGTGVFWIGSDY